MARAGMANLIQSVRELSNAGTADMTVGTVTYFSDDHLQGYLDKYRITIKDQPLQAIPDDNGTTVQYLEYFIPEPLAWFEESGADSGWALRTADGTVSPTINYEARIVTFSSDTAGSTIYLDCRVYDVYQAAADVLDRKADYEALNVDWSSDNHSVKASQVSASYRKIAASYRSKSGGMFAKMVRTDLA